MKVSKQEVTLIDVMGTDLSVVNAARVSFDKESTWEVKSGNRKSDLGILSQADTKLLNYLAKHNHWSPFSHASLSFRIKCPIFVARQLGKHQVGLSWNEVSRRYVDNEPEFYFPEYWRKKADNVKQGSSDEEYDGGFAWQQGLHKALTGVTNTYSAMVKNGCCAEQARMILPQNMMTEFIWSGSLYAFARVCNLRLDSHTQRETQEVAKMISDSVSAKFPNSWKVLVNHG